MKYKLKEVNLDFKEFSFSKFDSNNGSIINFKYKNDLLEFQTPKVFIEDLVKENGKEFIILKIIGNEACKIFCSKINQIETFFNESFKNHKSWFNDNLDEGHVIRSIFNEDLFKVKIPFKYSNPLIKVYKDDSPYNYYHLSKGMEIICLLNLDKIWINNYNECSYNLNVKEIMVL